MSNDYMNYDEKKLLINILILWEKIQSIDKNILIKTIKCLDKKEMIEFNNLLDNILDIKNKESNKIIAYYGAVTLNRLKHFGNIEITEPLFMSYELSIIDLYNPTEIERIYNEKIKEI